MKALKLVTGIVRNKILMDYIQVHHKNLSLFKGKFLSSSLQTEAIIRAIDEVTNEKKN